MKPKLKPIKFEDDDLPELEDVKPTPVEPKVVESEQDEEVSIADAINELYNRIVLIENKVRKHEHNKEGKAFLPAEEL